MKVHERQQKKLNNNNSLFEELIKSHASKSLLNNILSDLKGSHPLTEKHSVKKLVCSATMWFFIH